MYEPFYGLSGKPFQLNPDPDFFFASRGHARAYAYLQYGLHQSEGFIVITGDVGAGKTTIVRSLLQRLNPEKVVAAQLVSTQLDAEDLLQSVAAAFGIPSRATEKATLLAHIEAFLVALIPEGRRALLIVDEAQNLTARAVEELRMLSNFQLENRALLQSFLIGQPELRQVLQSAQMQQLRQRVIATYHLGPMDKAETQAYVEHRLKHVGWKGDPEFEQAAFEAIHTYSAGVPRRINLLCNRVMLGGYLGERHRITAGDVRSIAGELRQEFGPETVSAPLVPVAAAARQGGTTTSVAAGLGRATDTEIARLEDRVSRLERLLQSTVSLLHTLIEREQRGKSHRGG